MLEYTYDEAETLLSENLAAAEAKLVSEAARRSVRGGAACEVALQRVMSRRNTPGLGDPHTALPCVCVYLIVCAEVYERGPDGAARLHHHDRGEHESHIQRRCEGAAKCQDGRGAGLDGGGGPGLCPGGTGRARCRYRRRSRRWRSCKVMHLLNVARPPASSRARDLGLGPAHPNLELNSRKVSSTRDLYTECTWVKVVRTGPDLAPSR